MADQGFSREQLRCRYKNFKTNGVHTYEHFKAHVAKNRDGCAVNRQSPLHLSAGSLSEDAGGEKNNTKNGSLGRAAGLAVREQLIRRALAVVSKVVTGHVIISHELFNYFGGTRVIPYDIYGRLARDQMWLNHSRVPFSFSAPPIRASMVSINPLALCEC